MAGLAGGERVGSGLSEEHPRGTQGQPQDDHPQRRRQRQARACHPEAYRHAHQLRLGACLAQASGNRNDHQCQQEHGVDRPQRTGAEGERRTAQVQADIGEGGDLGEQHAETHGVGRQQRPAHQVAPQRRMPGRPGHLAIARQAQRNRQADDQAQTCQGPQCQPPVGELGHQAGEEAPAKAPQYRTSHIDTSELGHCAAAPAHADVGNTGREYHGNEHALHTAPQQEFAEAIRLSGQQCRHRQSERSHGDDPVLGHTDGQAAHQGGADGHGQRADGYAPAGLPQ